MLLLWQEERPKRICDIFWLKLSDRYATYEEERFAAKPYSKTTIDTWCFLWGYRNSLLRASHVSDRLLKCSRSQVFESRMRENVDVCDNPDTCAKITVRRKCLILHTPLCDDSDMCGSQQIIAVYSL